MEELDFRHLYSEFFGCAPSEFEERMFAKTLFRHALPFMPLFNDKRVFFREDFEMLREVASAKNTQEVISELNRFYGRNKRDRGFLRTSFFIRISGKRVLRLYRFLTAARSEHSSAVGDPVVASSH